MTRWTGWTGWTGWTRLDGPTSQGVQFSKQACTRVSLLYDLFCLRIHQLRWSTSDQQGIRGESQQWTPSHGPCQMFESLAESRQFTAKSRRDERRTKDTTASGTSSARATCAFTTFGQERLFALALSAATTSGEVKKG